MTETTWQSDVEALLRWTEKNSKTLARAKEKLSDDERRAIDAIIASRGDVSSLAQQLGPLIVAKLRVRGAQRSIKPVRSAPKAWALFETPLTLAWKPPTKADPAVVAVAFLRRYATDLDTLTDSCNRASKAATALADGCKAFEASRELLKSTAQLMQQIEELSTLAEECTHPTDDASRWAGEATHLARETTETIDLVRRLRSQLEIVETKARAIATGLREWAEASPRDRAGQAESMTVRIAAARDAAFAMREELLGVVFARA